MNWILFSVLVIYLISIDSEALMSSKFNSDREVVTCVSKHGSEDRGCSVNGNCCSSFGALVEDMNNNCQQSSNFSRIVIEVKSDLDLNSTVHFGNFCSKSLSLFIKGNNSVINCFNDLQRNVRDSGSGLYFNTIHGLSLKDITFLKCGSLQSSTSQNVSNSNVTTYLFPTTLYLLNCSDVNIINITIYKGHGTGAAFFDTVGNVKITNCTLENNWVRDSHYPGGGGLYIEFTNCTPGSLWNCHHKVLLSSQYIIQNSSFIDNSATLLSNETTGYVKPSVYFEGLGKGGGIAVYFNGNSKNHSVRVFNCTFHNNSAVFGGGMFIQYRDSPMNNSIIVENCNFTKNKCYIFGGGGVSGGFVISRANSIVTINNKINFTNCLFEENSAKGNGGGMSLFTTKGVTSNFSQNNTIYLGNCVWRRNSAFVASAFDLSPEVYSRLDSGILPIPIIDNCTFDSNFNTNNSIANGVDFSATEQGVAAVYISGYQVEFIGDIFFINNAGTGLYLSLASVYVNKRSNVHFESNHGKNGGGITMVAFSVLFVHDDCSLTFVNNTSDSKGGAIFVHSIDNQHESHFSHSCFIQYYGEFKNETFSFNNNTAKSDVGNAIFATSFTPCNHDNNLRKLLDIIGNTTKFNVASPPTKFSFDPESLDQIIPGTEITMNITAMDEQGQEYKNVVYEAFMMDSERSDIKIDPAYTQVSNNNIKFLGEKSTSPRTLTLETETVTLKINISLGECPPGFQNNGKYCECSRYEGITKCEDINSIIIRGFWIGRCNGDEVCTAHCPPGYCSYSGQNYENVKLPSSFNNLSTFICDEYRTGILCSQCKNGTSTYYHSHSYKCRPNKYCKFGVIFYLLSEIIPLTIVFLVVTIFNVSLTSGTVNGFVLFAQIADSIDISAQGSIEFPDVAKALSYPYRLIYRMFNFDFFSLESLSFCLWESATALDMMAITYVTITYALCLVFLTVFVLNSWKCKLFCTWFRPKTLRTTLTHGLTTLLIICFSQCARVCFLILNQTQLLYLDHQETVVFSNGALHPFHRGHLQYAIPAICFLTVLVFLPLVWLLLYPLLFKLLAICHLSESKVSQFLSKLFPIELLDAFQGCYKDNCRHFAGLYFFYRLIPLIFSNIRSHNTFYTSLSVLFLGMLLLHSVFQPYRTYSHNIVDSFMFTNLLLVNLLTMCNYGFTSSESYSTKGHTLTINHIVYAQVVLMYLPMVYIMCICVIKLYRKVKQHYSGYFKISVDAEDLPQLRDDADCSHGY